MLYRLAADTLVVAHLGFIFFVVVGGFLAWRWRRIAWIHLPVAWVCPLTPLENYFRRMAGEVGYEEGFIEHYVMPIVYPAHMAVGIQVGLGIFVLLLTCFTYSVYFIRKPG